MQRHFLKYVKLDERDKERIRNTAQKVNVTYEDGELNVDVQLTEYFTDRYKIKNNKTAYTEYKQYLLDKAYILTGELQLMLRKNEEKPSDYKDVSKKIMEYITIAEKVYNEQLKK